MNTTEKETLEAETKNLLNKTIMYDVTLSSQDFLAYCPYMFFFNEQLLCIGQITSKISLDTIHNYLDQILNDKGEEFEITVVPNVSEMKKQLQLLEASGNDIQNQNKIIEDAKKQILIYSV